MAVAFEQVHHLWCRDVVVLVSMWSREQLHSVPHKVTIKTHEQTTHSKIVRRNKAAESAIVCVAEWRVARRLVPSVEAIASNQSLVLVSVVKLLQDFSYTVSCQNWVFNSEVADIHHSSRLRQLLSQAVIHHFKPCVDALHLNVEQLVFPLIRPSLAFWVPCSWTGLRISVFNTGNVVLAI